MVYNNLQYQSERFNPAPPSLSEVDIRAHVYVCVTCVTLKMSSKLNDFS